MKNFKNIITNTCKLLIHKNILSTTLFSLALSFLLVGILLLSFWNIFPSVNWPRIILGGWYDSFLHMVWSFLISSLFFFLYPPTCTLISGLFLDKIVEKSFTEINKGKNVYFFGSNYFGGIYAGLKILIYSALIFIMVIILKLFFISNILIVLMIQFFANSYIIGKEYYEIVAVKVLPKNEIYIVKRKYFLDIFLIGILSNFIFLIPFLNLIAPIKITIIMTLRVNMMSNKLK